MSEYLDPATREEMYLDVIRRIAEGETVDVSNLIEPVSRVERYLYDICKNYSGGSSVEVESITITENGETTAPSGKAYSPVTVKVPNPNSYETVSSTLDHIFGSMTSVEITEIANAKNEMKATLYLIVKANAQLGLTSDAYLTCSVRPNDTYLYFTTAGGLVDNTISTAIDMDVELNIDGSVSAIVVLAGGNLVDMTAYASYLQTELLIIWHPISID